jgi:DNA polymerase III epsilon subunit-like protein
MSNSEQLKFITYDLCDMSLKGIPGGGKTKSIIDKILYLYDKRVIKSSQDFLILTFTKNSKKDFLRKGKLKNSKLFNDINVKTIHSLSGTIFNKQFSKNSSNLSTIVASLLYYLENDKLSLLNEVACLKKCKVIFVDEAQDISEIQYKVIKLISEKLGIYVIMIGDPDQNIYQFQSGSDKYLLEHSDKNIQLIINYRSTSNIVNFINHFRPWKNESEPMIAKREIEGKKPILYCGELKYLIDKLKDELMNTNIAYEDIAIIGPVKKGKFNLSGYNLNIGLQIFAEYFEENDIPYVSHYTLSSSDTNAKKKEKKLGHINLYTIHGSKGLEFKKVFLLNFHYESMGRVPNLRKYNEYKYLWYTGISRAEDELSILISKNKTGFLELRDCSRDLYDIHFEKLEYRTLFYDKMKNITPEDEEDIIEMISVTDLLDNRLFNEEKQYKLERLLNYTKEDNEIFEPITSEIKEHSEYAALYGIYMENIFTYSYLEHHNNDDVYHNDLKRFIKSFLLKNNHTIMIPHNLHKTFMKLKESYGELSLKTLRENIDKLDFEGRMIIKYLERIKNLNEEQPLTLKKSNNVSSFDQEFFMKHYKSLREGNHIYESLFYLCLYFYQIENECKSLLKKDFKEHLISLKPYIRRIIKYSRECSSGYKFQNKNNHSNLPIFGYTDIIFDNKIIDIKFTKTFKPSYVYQLLLYYNNMYPKWDIKKDLEIINLFTGLKTIINVDENLTNTKLNYYLCNTFNLKMKNNIIVYDLETTGLDTDSCEIIERYMYDMSLNDVFSEGLIKPRTRIPYHICCVTGITNDMVYDKENIINFKRELINKLKYYDKPVFIAHNGNNYDHKILKRFNFIDNNNSIFLDSRNIIHTHLKINTHKLDLSHIYKLFFNEDIRAHRAKEDTDMLLSIFNKININCEHIINNIVPNIKLKEN